MKTVDVSVLIATRSRPELLADTLRSLAAMSADALSWELLVIDNAPRGRTRDVVHGWESALPVRLLAEPKPGKNRALNVALSDISGRLVVFTDDDVIVERDWLSELRAGAARWPDASMFGGRVLPRWPSGEPPRNEHPFFEHAYAIADFSHPEGPYSSGYVYGPNMAIRREIFEAGWRFDTAIGPDGTRRYISGSETSLTVALEKAGHRAVYLPRALVHHQIRPEQLGAGWLYGRAFRMGRTDARRLGLIGGWRAIPRELVVTLGREYASWWKCRLRGDRQGALDHGLAFWRTRGTMYHCRVTPRADEQSGHTKPGLETRH